MGIAVDVESIIQSLSRQRPPKEWHQAMAQQVEAIRAAFGWDSIPWEEPSEHKGRFAGSDGGTSFNSSTFRLLWFLAHCAARDGNFVSMADEHQYSLQDAEYAKFLHLFEIGFYSMYSSGTIDSFYYLPVDFARPIHLSAGIGDFSIGSSIYLARELTVLESFIGKQKDALGDDTVVDPRNSSTRTWQHMYEVCSELLDGARESQTINLPLTFRG